MQITIIVNPIAGSARQARLDRAISGFNARGVGPVIRSTGKRGDAESWAAAEADRGCDIVVAAGGDGTVNEVANGLVGSRTALGVLPMGVANLLAMAMGIPSDPEGAVDAIINGMPRPVNPGYVILRDDSSGKERKRYFLLMTGIGFDGGVMHDMKRASVAKWGKAAYIGAGIRAIAKYTRTAFSIRIDHKQELIAYSAVVGKTPFYGGEFMVTPRASLQDEWLDLCAFTGPGALRMLKHACCVLTGIHPRQGGIYYAKSGELDVRSHDPVFVQADGDCIGTLPASLGVCKHALQIVAPGYVRCRSM